MRNHYGWRAVVVVAVLALACRWGVAQIGPRYVIELPGGGAPAAAQSQGLVRLAGKGLALIRFQGLRILTVDADAESYSAEAARDWPAADLVLVTPPGIGRYAGLAPLQALRADMPVIVAEAADGAATPAHPQLYPMQTWNTLELRKQATRLRVTAMAGAPGRPGVGGFMLDLGNGHASYRVYVSCAALEEGEAAGLAQRLPGADLALLPARQAPELLPLKRASGAIGKPAALTAAGYAFTAIRR